MLPILNYYNLSLFLGGVIALAAGSFVFFDDPKKTANRAWLLLNISSAVWSFGYYAMLVASSQKNAVLSDIVLHIGAIFIPFFYFFFVIAIAGVYSRYKKVLYCLIPVVIALLAITPTDLFVNGVFPKGSLAFAPNAGPLYIYFTIYFFAIVIWALFILLFQSRKVARDEALRLRYILLSSVAGFLGGGSVFFMTFNIFIPPFPLVLFAFYPVVIGYTILRYSLFNVKVIATELLTGTLWVTLLFRTVLSDNVQDQVINSVVLVLTVIFGILLIKNVYNEVHQREKIEKLAADLEKANVRLTELDRQKSEFVSFATHQLRAPLTAMKGYASLILEGDMGTIPPEAKQAVSRIFESTNTLASIVDDYLNITRIELGTMKYAFETIDLKTLIEDTIGELKPNIEKAPVKFTFEAENAGMDYRITADRDKLKQVIANLIDNSLKYTPSGSVAVTLSYDKPRHRFIFRLKDTGIGIAPETLPLLFQKFTRAGNANKTNIKGTGLGLFVAKEIVTAHHGDIHVESAGEGKGSTFTVELEPFAKA